MIEVAVPMTTVTEADHMAVEVVEEEEVAADELLLATLIAIRSRMVTDSTLPIFLTECPRMMSQMHSPSTDPSRNSG
jgi:hypothetical protein